MHKSSIIIKEHKIPLTRVTALIIGSGAAGLNAAIQLYEKGVTDMAIVTDKWGGGTSNNAGSDKQTYYRLDPFNPEGDSVVEMAKSLQSGGCMQGDIALIEAAYSMQAFYHLVACGVPFPHDAYGRYPGYQTDHDLKGRGTSAGPRTSRFMFQSLAAKVVNYQIPIMDNRQLIRLLYHDDGSGNRKIRGCVVLNLDSGQSCLQSIEIIQSEYIILATGGPGELFHASVYPEGQYGANGFALEIGAQAQNMTEFQFGIASKGFRWNLSGSYQQVVPRYFSLDEHHQEHDFLNDHFSDPKELTQAIFLKGYQWPFDPEKVSKNGSSLIDILVYHEIHEKNRRVFVDYRTNPISSLGLELTVAADFSSVVKDYLDKSDAAGTQPVDRLKSLNLPAYDLFRKNGIDLAQEALEIDVCAQHCNGGIGGSLWWESSVDHLFVIGEANGSHGVYRPGGSALNAGQVGGIRAAMRIAEKSIAERPKWGRFSDELVWQMEVLCDRFLSKPKYATLFDAQRMMQAIKARSDQSCGILRSEKKCLQSLKDVEDQRKEMERVQPVGVNQVAKYYIVREQLLVQRIVLESILAYIRKGGASRGSFLIMDQTGSEEIPGLKSLRYHLDRKDGYTRTHQFRIHLENESLVHEWKPVNPVPEEELWFEKVWKEFRHEKKK